MQVGWLSANELVGTAARNYELLNWKRQTVKTCLQSKINRVTFQLSHVWKRQVLPKQYKTDYWTEPTNNYILKTCDLLLHVATMVPGTEFLFKMIFLTTTKPTPLYF